MNPDSGKYYLLIENLPDAFAYHQVITDDDGIPVDYIFLEVNAAFEEMTGLKRKELIGKKVTEVLPGIEKSEFDWIGTYGKVALSGEPIRFESYSELLCRWYDISAYTDKLGFFATAFRDISINKKTEQALLDSEEKHRRLFETLAQGVIYQAADGKIISANPAAEKILGLSLEQVLGKTSMDPRWQMIEEDGTPVPGTDHPTMTALRTGQKVGPVTRGIYRPDLDSHIWLSLTAIPLFLPGETYPFQAYATFTDVTERKTTENRLEKEFNLRNSLLDNIPNCIALILKKDTREIVASNMAGHAIGAVPGKT